MKKGFIIILIIICNAGILISQDIHFSQIDNTPLILNPSLAGYVNGDTRTILNYKEQWRSITVPYRTIAASFDMPFFREKWKKDYLGIGLSLFSDKAGDASMGTTKFDFSLACNKAVAKSHDILFGLQAGWGQRSWDITKLTWDNQYDGYSFDPSLPSNEPVTNNNFSYFDMAAGGSWKYSPTKNFNSMLGLSVFHINQPRLNYYKESDARLHPKLVIHGGINFLKKGTNMTFIPGFIYLRQTTLQEFTFGSMFRYRLQEASNYTGYYDEKAISFGIWYRLKDAFIPCIRYELANSYFIDVSYDVNLSKLSSASHSRGGFEISLMFLSHGAKSKRELIKASFN